MNDITKAVKTHEESGLLIEGVSETVKNEAKEQRGEFSSALLGTLGASLLGNMLASKEKTIDELELVKIFNAVSYFN